MKASRERLLIVLAVSVLLLAVVFIGMSAVTERNRRAAVDRLKNSEVLQRYKQTHREENQAGSGTSTQREGEPSAGQPAAADTDKEKIAAFAHAFERIKALSEDTKWNEARDKLSKPLRERTEEDWARQKELIAQVHDLISEIRHLAEMGGPAYELDLSTKGIEEMMPHWAVFRVMARLLDSDALVRGREGDYSEAVEDILALLGLAAIVRDEPTLMSQLNAMAIEGMSFGAAEIALPAEEISSDLARRLIEYTGRADLRGHFADSFSGEGMFGLEQFDNVREGRGSDGFFSGIYGSVFARPWLNMDEETYLDTIQRFAEIARLPYYEALPQVLEMEQDIADLPLTRILSRPFLRMLESSFASSMQCEARNEAMIDLMRIGISVEQYRATTGKYPATLDAIASSIGGTVPVDPFTGQPYRYQPSSASFLLYSVGSNLTDDGGINDRRGGEGKTGDIVWRGQEKRKG
jgi:hypothetical protein